MYSEVRVQLLLLLTCLFTFVNWTEASTVTLYNHTSKYGDFVLLNVKGCTNVPRKWRDAASSLDVHGSCLVFFDDFDCLGKRVTLQPHHKKYMENLETLGFNDLIKSIRPCGPKSKNPVFPNNNDLVPPIKNEKKFRRMSSGAKVDRGIHVIQSPVDGTVLTIRVQNGQFFANTEMTYWRRKKSQLWKIGKYGPKVGINYDMTPVEYPYYNPVTYTKFEAKKNSLGEAYMPRRFFDIQPLPDSKYLIKILHTDKCLVNNGRGRPVGKTQCAPWMANQQWNFIRIDRAAGPPHRPPPPPRSLDTRPPFI